MPIRQCSCRRCGVGSQQRAAWHAPAGRRSACNQQVRFSAAPAPTDAAALPVTSLHILSYRPDRPVSSGSKLPQLRAQAPTCRLGSCACSAPSEAACTRQAASGRGGRALLCCSTECASGRSAPRRSGDTFVLIQQMSSQRRKPHLRRQCRPASRPSALPHLQARPGPAACRPGWMTGWTGRPGLGWAGMLGWLAAAACPSPSKQV
jgi:hypothetical protein